MPIAERRTARLERLAEQHARLVELALVLHQQPQIMSVTARSPLLVRLGGERAHVARAQVALGHEARKAPVQALHAGRRAAISRDLVRGRDGDESLDESLVGLAVGDEFLVGLSEELGRAAAARAAKVSPQALSFRRIDRAGAVSPGACLCRSLMREAISGHQRPSELIRAHQRSSEAIRDVIKGHQSSRAHASAAV